MSADNYYRLFKSKDGKFRAYMFFASEDVVDHQEPKRERAQLIADTPEELEHLVSQEYAEYGWHWVNYCQVQELKAEIQRLNKQIKTHVEVKRRYQKRLGEVTKESFNKALDGNDEGSKLMRALLFKQGLQLADLRRQLELPNENQVAAEVHLAWMKAKRKEGITSRKSESGEELMVPYETLSDRAKELDLATVRTVYKAIKNLREGLDHETDV